MTPVNPAEVVTLIKDSLETADQALDLYDKVLDRIIPWGTFEATLTRLDEYRNDYSNEAAGMVGKVRTLLADCQDHYFQAVERVYQWCGTATVVLPAYVNALMDPAKVAVQRPLLLKLLELGLQHIDEGIAKLEASSQSFNKADGELAALYTRLGNDFNSKSDYFKSQVDKVRKEAYGGAAAGIVLGPFGLIVSYSIAAGVVEGKLIPELTERFEKIKEFFKSLQQQIQTSQASIAGAKISLKNEVTSLGELKSEIKTTQIFVEIDTEGALKEEIMTAANKLKESCIAYRDRHQPGADIKTVAMQDTRQLINDILTKDFADVKTA